MCLNLKTLDKKLLFAIILLSLIATFNAAYLTYMAYSIKAPLAYGQAITPFACDFNSVLSCSWVFSHSFAWFWGIPFSLLALIVYPVIIGVATLWFMEKIKNHFKILFFVGLGGVLFNGYIIYNEILVNVFCLLCLMCTGIIITIIILSKIWMCSAKKKEIATK